MVAGIRKEIKFVGMRCDGKSDLNNHVISFSGAHISILIKGSLKNIFTELLRRCQGLIL